MACVTGRPQCLHKATITTQGHHYQYRVQNVNVQTRTLSSVRSVGAGLYGGSAGDRAATFCTKPIMSRSRQTGAHYIR